MKQIRHSSPQGLKRERTELVDLSSNRPEKMGKPIPKATISRDIHSLSWREALVKDTGQLTFTPQENIETILLEVEPVVMAMYYDDVALLKKILSSEPLDLTFYTNDIISNSKAASLLDIAVKRLSYKCLEFFKDILTLSKPEITLKNSACLAICSQKSTKLIAAAQLHCPELGIEACANQANLAHLYFNVAPKLRELYTISQQSALEMAKHDGDLQAAQLIQHAFTPTKNK